jgi:hypothetical protein
MLTTKITRVPITGPVRIPMSGVRFRWAPPTSGMGTCTWETANAAAIMNAATVIFFGSAAFLVRSRNRAAPMSRIAITHHTSTQVRLNDPSSR